MTDCRTMPAIRLLVLAIAATVAAPGQEFRATITGRVTDPSGTGIPNAKVTVTNQATNEKLTATTGDEGTYTVPFVPPGTHSVSVEASGFKTAIRQPIETHVGDRVAVDIAMEVGQVQETVNVTAEAPLLETATASRGGVIENLRITELPLNGRNPFNLANLTTGVQFAGNLQFTRPFDNGDNVNFSINGGLRQTNEYLLDGAPDNAVTDNNDLSRTQGRQNIAYIPAVDTTQEFKISTNFYDSQYGRTGGGIVNVSTKSGANDLHGSVYEFMRRYQLDANYIQNNRANPFRPRYAVEPGTGKNLGGHKLDQYGGVVTGPVYLPKVYNGKDKTFFMFGFENYIESTPSPGTASVPTLLERTGDFSRSGINIYDPFSTRENPAFNPAQPESTGNPRYIRTQFPNNIIPADRINPVGRAILAAVPEPNIGDATTRFNNFLASPNLSEDKFKNWIARVDHNFSQQQRMFFRYAHNRRNQFDNGAAGLTGIWADRQDPLTRINDNAVVDSLTVLSPSSILNLRAGFTRFVQAAYRERVIGFDATTLGFPASFSAARPVAIPPRLDIQEYTTLGSRNPNSNITNALSLQGTFSHIRGRHSMKAGVEFRDIRVNVSGGSFVYGGGYFNFNREFTRQYPQFSDTTTGSAIASVLLGAPASGYVESGAAPAFRWPYWAVFLQDDIKLTARLTVNLGLRWDFEGAPTERFNRMNRGFAFDQASPIAPQVRNANAADCPACANLRGGLLFAGTGGLPEAGFENDWNNIQPRVGAAYQLASNMAIRGGYGIFYLPEAIFPGSNGFSIRTPFVATQGGGVAAFTPAGTLSNPFPGGLLPPTGASLGLSTQLGNGFTFALPERRIPYVHQYSFGVERQFPGAIRVEAAYVGSRTRGLNTLAFQAGGARNINVLNRQQLEQGGQNPSFLTQQVPNPFAGLLPGNPGLNGATIQRQQLLLPWPQFTNINMGAEPVGRLYYDSLQVNVEKRYSTGLVLVAAYTLSKNLESVAFLNDQDDAPSKALTSNDRTHRFVFSGVYQLPFGRGKRFARDIGRGWNLLVGGWEYNWIGTYQSGTPIDFNGNFNLIADPAVADQSFDNWFNPCVLQSDGTSRQPNAAHNGFTPCNSPAWAVRAPFTLRTIPFRSSQIRNPWRPQWDMSLNKALQFTEKVNFQFRFEAFNVFNTPILGNVDTNPNSTNFGFVQRNQINFPRQVQLGFKFNW